MFGPVRRKLLSVHNEIEVEHLTFGQRAAGRVAAIVGSWWFIVTQSVILAGSAWLDHLTARDEALTKIVEALAATMNGNR